MGQQTRLRYSSPRKAEVAALELRTAEVSTSWFVFRVAGRESRHVSAKCWSRGGKF